MKEVDSHEFLFAKYQMESFRTLGSAMWKCCWCGWWAVWRTHTASGAWQKSWMMRTRKRCRAGDSKTWARWRRWTGNRECLMGTRQYYGNIGQERAAAALLHEKRQVDTRARCWVVRESWMWMDGLKRAGRGNSSATEHDKDWGTGWSWRCRTWVIIMGIWWWRAGECGIGRRWRCWLDGSQADERRMGGR